MYNLVQEEGSYVDKNRAALMSQLRGNTNEWFELTLRGPKVASLASYFDSTLEAELDYNRLPEDENDINNDSSDDRDQSTTNWDDALDRSFEKVADLELTAMLDSLFKLDAYVPIGSTDYSYDTNNELGVPVTMGAKYIISQMKNYVSFNSINDMIESMDRISRINPNLYGLAPLINELNTNHVLANKVFSQLSSYLVIKTLATIEDNGVDFRRSNPAADAIGYTTFSMMNQARFNFRTAYGEKALDNLKSQLYSANNTTLEEFTNDDIGESYADQAFSDIMDVIESYFPNIDSKSIRTAMFAGPGTINENTAGIISNLIELMERSNRASDVYNTAMDKYSREMRAYTQQKNDYRDYGIPIERPVFRANELDFSVLNLPIIQLAKKLVNYIDVKNDLNSFNAEGNLASDLIGSNFISNTFMQIAYGTE